MDEDPSNDKNKKQDEVKKDDSGKGNDGKTEVKYIFTGGRVKACRAVRGYTGSIATKSSSVR
jgi:hypothetical protein